MTETYKEYAAWKDWSREDFGFVGRSEDLYFQAELQKCGVQELERRRVLELGFGNGSFARFASKRGAHYSGTELIPELLRRAKALGYDVHDGRELPTTQFRSNSIDIVVAFDVLEHIKRDELTGLLKSVRTVLKPDGVLIARMPSGDSPFSGPIWFGDLTHKTMLGSSAVVQLAELADLRVASIREPAFPLAGMGVITMMRRAAIVLLRKLVLPVLARGFMGRREAVLAPNMVFVLRKGPDESEA